MFIYSIRASTVKFLGFILFTVLLVGFAVLSLDSSSVYASAAPADVNYGGVGTPEAREAFVRSFGLEIDPDSLTEESFTMPESFDRVILGYNELQKKQGLDLSKYAKKRVTRYTWRVTNYNADGEVYVNLFVFRSTVVACDVSSADPEGFVVPLTLVEPGMLKG